MSEELSRVNERIYAVRRSHRGVVTKLVREAEEIITATTGPLSAGGRNQLRVIKQQLEVKLTTLEQMDKDILSSCDPSRIVTEIEELDAIVSKVFSCKFKIDELLAVMASASVTSPLPTVATPPLITSKP